MKKPRDKRKKKKPKKAGKAGAAKPRGPRIKLHKGPFQIELPLQMPLFPPTYTPNPDGDKQQPPPASAP